MTSLDVLLEVSEKCEWGIPEQFNLMLEYIENQKSNDVFRDFLLDKVDVKKEEENKNG